MLGVTRPSTIIQRRELEDSWGGEQALVAAVQDYDFHGSDSRLALKSNPHYPHHVRSGRSCGKADWGEN